MTEANVQQYHLARLSVWNRLFHGQPVTIDELDVETLCGDTTSDNERTAYVVLRACVAITQSARQTMRAAFRVVILYWLSNVGEPRDVVRGPLQPQSTSFHLGEALGARLTWDQAVALMGRKPVDVSAYYWLLDVLRAEYATQWQAVFSGEPATLIKWLSGSIHEADHARGWGTAMEPSPKRSFHTPKEKGSS